MSATASEINKSISSLDNTHVTQYDISPPLSWLRKGLDDFSKAPGLSLLYGLVFATAVSAVYITTHSVFGIALSFLTGLVFIGPFAAAGLYTVSRDIERGQRPGIRASVSRIMGRSTDLALFSLILILIMAAWVRFSALMFAFTYSTLSPSPEAFLTLFSGTDGWIAMSFYAITGLLLVSVVFVISAVSVPLILDSDKNAFEAIATSYRVVTQNLKVMIGWAATIVVFTAVGIATGFIGFIAIFPVLGYATWHSYRELVG